MPPGHLISANTTTGWFDWTPGALWLLPDGILRSQTDVATIRDRDDLKIDPSAPYVRDFAEGEAAKIGGRHTRGIWVTADRIAAATIRRGLTTNSLVLNLRDGSRVKLLWIRRDRAEQPLADALAGWGVPTTGA